MDWFTFHKRDVTGEKPGPARKNVLVAVGLISLFLAVSLTAAGFAWAKKEVTVVDGKDKQTISTYKRTVGDLLPTLEMEPPGSHDRIDPPPETRLKDGLVITVTRAVPVTIVADGNEQAQMTTAKTVGALLEETGVKIGPDDLVEPGRSTAVEPRLTVTIVRVSAETVDEEKEIPFNVTRKTVYNLAKGQTKEETTGVPGLKRETWRITYHDGEEASRECVDTEVIREPRDRVVLVGAVQTVSRSGQDLRFSRSFAARATAYTYTGRNTATGKAPGPGTVAVDPAVVPLGSRLYIDGYGHGTAMDVGRSIKGHRIDVFFPTRAQALSWGSRSVNVYVLQ